MGDDVTNLLAINTDLVAQNERQARELATARDILTAGAMHAAGASRMLEDAAASLERWVETLQRMRSPRRRSSAGRMLQRMSASLRAEAGRAQEEVSALNKWICEATARSRRNGEVISTSADPTG